MTASTSAAQPLGVDVVRAITERRSTRAFRDEPVSREVIEAVLDVAGRAPSGSNIQPWRVYVLIGERKAALERDLVARHEAGAPDPQEYQYYPAPWREPYLSRRRKIGWDLYQLLGILRDDKAGMARQLGLNYVFFGAPVGLIFTIERDLPVGSWLDYGMFLQSVMLAARGFGLETCPQQAFAAFHETVRAHLGASADEVVICGMSLGYPDSDALVNRLTTDRRPVSDFVSFL